MYFSNIFFWTKKKNFTFQEIDEVEMEVFIWFCQTHLALDLGKLTFEI